MVPYRTVAISNIPSTMNRKKGLAQKIQKMRQFSTQFCSIQNDVKLQVTLTFSRTVGRLPLVNAF